MQSTNIIADQLDKPTDARSSSCFLCGSTSGNVVVREGEYEGWLCECGLVYTVPRPTQQWDDFLVDHHSDEFYGNPAKLKAKWLSRHCPMGRLLEVGCGMGEVLAAARDRGYEVVGMEPNPQRAQHVREEYSIEVHEQFVEQNTVEDRFDVVYHCDLLSHFPDPILALQQMMKLLKPNGVLCFEVGVLGGVSPLWYERIGGIGLDCHIWLYSERALQQLFAKAELEVVARRRYGLGLYVLVPRYLEGLSSWLKQLVRGAGESSRRSTVGPVARPPHAMSCKTWFMAKLKYFLRYYVGSVSPPLGPQTLLFVLRPKRTEKNEKSEV